jgi:hypothetical protein
VRPQVLSGSLSQMPWGSTEPRETASHAPAFPGKAQLTQAPEHSSLQQTPSAQNPEAHSVPQTQRVPSAF